MEELALRGFDSPAPQNFNTRIEQQCGIEIKAQDPEEAFRLAQRAECQQGLEEEPPRDRVAECPPVLGVGCLQAPGEDCRVAPGEGSHRVRVADFHLVQGEDCRAARAEDYRVGQVEDYLRDLRLT